MPTAVFLSPHLDDVAFSCGGTFAVLAAAGWRCHLVTAFTRSVPNPSGFALACQTDKGLSPDVDYMALRRAEDAAAGRALGAADVVWLDFPEAPHRGYGSAAELFAGARGGDDVWEPLADRLRGLVRDVRPDRVYAPQGLGNHVDHIQLIRAVTSIPDVAPLTWWYRDTPYAIRDPDALPSPQVPADLTEQAVDITPGLTAKLDACACYASQLGFQFGGEAAMRERLPDLARREAARLGGAGPVEVFRRFAG